MEFEVLQEALVEVMNVAPNEIHMDTTLAGDLGMVHWMHFRSF